MSWIKIRDGYVKGEAIEAIRRSNYLYENKYRLILDTVGGNTYIANEYDTAEECDDAVERIVDKLDDIDEREIGRLINRFINDKEL